MTGKDTYVFGDSDAESQRLRLVELAFSAATQALLEDAAGDCELAYDLGCGPGATTQLLERIIGPAELIGLDGSDALLSRARDLMGPAARFCNHDVTEVPFPAGPGDLIFARFVLAHLAAPAKVARDWASQLRGRGLLVLEEIEWIRTEEPVLAAHLELVTEMIERTGAPHYAGSHLWGVGETPGIETKLAHVREHSVPTSLAAQMFSLSFGSFSDQAVELGLIDATEADRHQAALTGLATVSSPGENVWGIHHAIYRREELS
jgi:SAM-dependent methyltransferase